MIRLVPRLFARLEKCSFECIIPLDINEFIFVRYIFQFCRKVTHFSRKTCRMCYLFYCSSHRIEYDSNSLMGICSSVAVLRQSLMAAQTSSIVPLRSTCLTIPSDHAANLCEVLAWSFSLKSRLCHNTWYCFFVEWTFCFLNGWISVIWKTRNEVRLFAGFGNWQ